VGLGMRESERLAENMGAFQVEKRLLKVMA
jgi:hypothetical protein